MIGPIRNPRVYFIQLASGPVKVGWSRNVPQRCKLIAARREEPAEILGHLAGTARGVAAAGGD